MAIPGLPPELKRLASIYEFIPPEDFAGQGIDPEDVPLGSFPAYNHPPFLPDRFGGNAYGLGLFEYDALNEQETLLLDSLDLSDADAVRLHHSTLNDIMKRLGLLIRFTAQGRQFYLIPRQYIIHFSAEIQSKADWIEDYLNADWIEDYLSKVGVREMARIGIVANQAGLLIGELQGRLPRFEFIHLDSLQAMNGQPCPLQTVIILNPPAEIDFLKKLPGQSPSYHGASQVNIGYFIAGKIHELLDDQGTLLIVCDSSNFDPSATLKIQFTRQDEYKRFLLFTHIYRTQKRYDSSSGLNMSIHATDFYTFLTAQGLYHEILESMLDGKALPQVTPPEIDELPFQDLPLPALSGGQDQQAYWRACLAPYFNINLLENTLPPLHKKFMEENYRLENEPLQTLLVGRADKRVALVNYDTLAAKPELKFLAGCPRALLAPYKNTFTYLLKTLEQVKDINQGRFPGLSARKQRMLLGTFEDEHPMVQDARRLLSVIDELKDLEGKINPNAIIGMETPVLENLGKLGLLGLDEGVLGQIYLTVLGHSTLGRVCLGKLSEQTLAPLVDLKHYKSLEDAISTINLCRLFSLAETASSDYISKHPNLMAEIFSMSLLATRVLTDSYTSWSDIEREREQTSGGLKNQVVIKLLKLLNLFDFAHNWSGLVSAGPYQQEVLCNFDQSLYEKAGQVLALHYHISQFLEFFHVNDTQSRPYFFRALLACHVHGVSRLLPRLGAKAAFNLLWICVHVSDLRVINLNGLPNPYNDEQKSKFNMLRHNLESLNLKSLAPAALDLVRQNMLRQKKAYVHDTGIYLTIDEKMEVLIPSFLEPKQIIQELGWETQLVAKQSLERSSDQQLSAIDRAFESLEEYFEAVPDGEDAPRFRAMKSNLLHHLLSQLISLPELAPRLARLAQCCPHLLQSLLGAPEPEKPLLAIQAAAKISALLHNRMDQFQNMQLSYETAVAEFGPSATGIVGVSKIQFIHLMRTLRQSIENQPVLAEVIALSILLADTPDPLQPSRLLGELEAYDMLLSEKDLYSALNYLLDNHSIPWQIINGGMPIGAIQPVLSIKDENLLDVLFVISIVFTASQAEGFMKEDLLEHFLFLWRVTKIWHTEKRSANEITAAYLKRHQMFYDALSEYLANQEGVRPIPRWHDFSVYPGARIKPRPPALHQAATDRFMRLCGLYFIEAIEVRMYKAGIPAAFIYRNKRLHSRGLASYSEDLELAVMLNDALHRYPEAAALILDSLSNYRWPVIIKNFFEAGGRLNPTQKTTLLGLGLAAVVHLRSTNIKITQLDFANLVVAGGPRINLLAYEIDNTHLDKLANTSNFESFSAACTGFTFDAESGILYPNLAASAHVRQLAEVFDLTTDIKELDELYRKEELVNDYQALPDVAEGIESHLEQAYVRNLNRLIDKNLDEARMSMGQAVDLTELNQLLAKYKGEFSQFPQDRINVLTDLYALNMERIHSELISRAIKRLSSVHDLDALDDLWHEIIPMLRESAQVVQDNSLSLSLAAFFDRRARELSR